MGVNTTAVIAVGFLLFFSAGAAFILTSETNEVGDPVVSVLAKVNYNGSGIFCNEDLDINDPEGWGGKVFMTPGPGSIQHEMLKTLAFNLGFYFALDGPAKNRNTIYWTIVTPGQQSDQFARGYVDGGIAWEPAFSTILRTFAPGNDSGIVAYNVATSKDIEDGHACCMIVAKNSFIDSHPDLVIRFLLAYMESVEWVNEAKDKSSPNHEMLVQQSWEISFGGTGPVPDDRRQMIENALENINFGYELDGLREYVASLITRFENSGSIIYHIPDTSAYANMLVNYEMMDSIVSDHDKLVDQYKYSAMSDKAVRLGVLANDLHQIAVRLAMVPGIAYAGSLSFFGMYGVPIAMEDPVNAGGAVMNLFALDAIDIGVLGLPPTVIRSVNGL
ncbi:MAG: ABC transporter substrate-binding protein [Methanomassiliicoccaceae archaeon]|nr:ABC transporter substrate-binding protein [Methanomassiliicoccaceae archaeon]